MRSSTITLFIDTSSSFLYSGLIKDNEIVEIDRNLVKMTGSFLEKYIEE